MSIITLTSDIGTQDFVIGAIKGQLLSRENTVNISDISHFLPAFNFLEASYVCRNAFKYYPKGTIHIVLINSFDPSPDHVLISNYHGQYLICPDNGILTMIACERPTKIRSLKLFNAKTILDITAQIAEVVHQILGGLSLDELGQEIKDINEKYPLQPTAGSDWIEAQILFIDRFENVVVNVTMQQFEQRRKGRKFRIVFNREETIRTISTNYSDVPEGEKLAWFNSADYLEISLNKGYIAGLFGLKRYNENQAEHNNAGNLNQWFYHTVRIFFE